MHSKVTLRFIDSKFVLGANINKGDALLSIFLDKAAFVKCVVEERFHNKAIVFPYLLSNSIHHSLKQSRHRLDSKESTLHFPEAAFPVDIYPLRELIYFHSIKGSSEVNFRTKRVFTFVLHWHIQYLFSQRHWIIVHYYMRVGWFHIDARTVASKDARVVVLGYS